MICSRGALQVVNAANLLGRQAQGSFLVTCVSPFLTRVKPVLQNDGLISTSPYELAVSSVIGLQKRVPGQDLRVAAPGSEVRIGHALQP